MRPSALLVVVAALVVGCGSEGTAVVTATTPPAAATEPVQDASATHDPPEAQDTPPTQDAPATQDVPDRPAGLANCEDLPELGSAFEGKLSGRQNPDPIVLGVMATYANEHPDTYGGRWIDRDSGGVLVMGFTDDPEPHRAAILTRAPSPDDDVGMRPRPPITDPRPLSERNDVVIDVVRVRFSELEVEAMREELMGSIPWEDWSDLGLDGSGYDIKRQRVTLYLVNPPEGALDEIEERVPDPSVLCVNVTRTPQPPSGPLDVIPDLDVEDPLVSCGGTPVVRYSQMIDPPSIDEVEHPAVDLLRTELDTPGGEPLPRGRWVVISIDDDLATFAALSDGGFGLASIERRGDRWRFSGHGPPAHRASRSSRCRPGWPASR